MVAPGDQPADEGRVSATNGTPKLLDGLEHLAKVAVVGHAGLMELASRPILYIWRDIAIAGTIVVLAGGVGCGKTTLLFLVIIARANLGAPIGVLLREVTPAPVGSYIVLIEAEHGDSSTARKLVRSCKLLGVDEHCLDRLIVVARRSVRIGSPAWLDVEKLIARGLVSDLVCDTIARIAPSDANAEGEQIAIYDRIAQAIERAPTPEAQPVVWVAAHTKKDAVGDALEDVLGSTQRTGQADTVLLVRAERRDGRVVSSKVTFAKLREDPDDYPTPVDFVIRGSELVGVTTPQVDERPLEDRVLERLKLGPKTKNALAKDLNRNASDVDEAITCLFDARRIRTTSVKVRGRQFKAFELRNDTRLDTRLHPSPDAHPTSPDANGPNDNGGLFPDA
jgi:AAA domain